MDITYYVWNFILCRSASITSKCIVWIHVHFNTSSHVRHQKEPIKVTIDFCIYSLIYIQKMYFIYVCMYRSKSTL